MANKIYCGIGSRETPEDILQVMRNLGYTLGKHGWTLRSGRAPGADKAFEYGASLAKGAMEIYLPWPRFEGASDEKQFITPSVSCSNYEDALSIAAQFHPAWSRCTDGARKMHARNVYQIAGQDLNTRTNFVVCWTKNGKREGGTGQALRMASYLDLPIFDLALVRPEAVLEYINHGVLP